MTLYIICTSNLKATMYSNEVELVITGPAAVLSSPSYEGAQLASGTGSHCRYLSELTTVNNCRMWRPFVLLLFLISFHQRYDETFNGYGVLTMTYVRCSKKLLRKLLWIFYPWSFKLTEGIICSIRLDFWRSFREDHGESRCCRTQLSSPNCNCVWIKLCVHAHHG